RGGGGGRGAGVGQRRGLARGAVPDGRGVAAVDEPPGDRRPHVPETDDADLAFRGHPVLLPVPNPRTPATLRTQADLRSSVIGVTGRRRFGAFGPCPGLQPVLP